MRKLLFIIAILVAIVGFPHLGIAATLEGSTTYEGGFTIHERAIPAGNPTTNQGWLYVKDDGGVSTLYWEDDGGTVTDLLAAGGAVAYDDVGDPDANTDIDFTTYTNTWDMGGVADMFVVEFTGDFADVSGMLLEQMTGSPTDGTILEIEMADTDPDFISLSTGGVEKVNIDSDGTITMSAGDIVLTAGDLTMAGDLSVAGTWSVDAITAATATQTFALNGNGIGGVNIGSTSTGDITLGDDVVVSDGYNVTIGEGTLTVDNDSVTEDAVVITASAAAAGSALDITSANTTSQAVSIVATGTTSGDVLYLGATDATLAGGGNYIECYDGGAVDFNIARYGATTIAGNAATNVLTLTAGDIQITNGDIDLDNGQLMVDTTQDLGNNISRNFVGVGTAAVLTVAETNPASTNSALSVSNAGTAGTGLTVTVTGANNSTGLAVVHSGDYPALDISAGAARTGDVINIPMADQLAEKAINIDGAWTGTAGEGLVDLYTSAEILATASLLRLDADTAQADDGSDGYMLNVDDDTLVATTPSVYAVLIDSNANEALHVATGTSLFDEIATFTAGITSNGATILGDAVTDNITAAGAFVGAGPLILDGATDNTEEITVTVTDPTTDKNFNIPDSNVNMEAMTSIGVGLTTYTESAVATEVITEATVAVAAGHAAAGQVYTWEVTGEKTGANNTYAIILVLDGTTALTLTASDAAAATFTARVTCIMVTDGTSLVYGELLENGKVTVQGRASVTDDLSGAVDIGLSMTLADAGDEVKVYNTLVTYNE